DCIQFSGKIWGIIPASREQAKLAAQHILELNPEPYKGTFWNTRLKIAGIKLTCLGTPEEDEEKETNLIQSVNEEKYLCRKVRIENNEIKSAILLGPGKDNFFVKNLGKKVDLDEVKKKVNEQ
ncbi:MAG: hypothetical protein ACTSRX_07790, partial [Promethearchaeota archaeon]